MKKRIVSVVLVIVFALSLCAPAFAAEMVHWVTPQLSFDGTMAHCEVAIPAVGLPSNKFHKIYYPP